MQIPPFYFLVNLHIILNQTGNKFSRSIAKGGSETKLVIIIRVCVGRTGKNIDNIYKEIKRLLLKSDESLFIKPFTQQVYNHGPPNVQTLLKTLDLRRSQTTLNSEMLIHVNTSVMSDTSEKGKAKTQRYLIDFIQAGVIKKE